MQFQASLLLAIVAVYEKTAILSMLDPEIGQRSTTLMLLVKKTFDMTDTVDYFKELNIFRKLPAIHY